MNADGSGVVRLPHGYGYINLDFSPNGKQIAVDGIGGYHIVPTGTFALSAAEH